MYRLHLLLLLLFGSTSAFFSSFASVPLCRCLGAPLRTNLGTATDLPQASAGGQQRNTVQSSNLLRTVARQKPIHSEIKNNWSPEVKYAEKHDSFSQPAIAFKASRNLWRISTAPGGDLMYNEVKNALASSKCDIKTNQLRPSFHFA